MGHPLFYNNCSHCYISSALHCQTTIVILLCHRFISQSDRNLQCGTDNNFKYSSESNGPIPRQRHKVTVQLCRSSWESDETGFDITAVTTEVSGKKSQMVTAPRKMLFSSKMIGNDLSMHHVEMPPQCVFLYISLQCNFKIFL